MSIIIKGLGGFGYKGKGVMKTLPTIPTRNPDHVLKGTSYPNQAWLYRLTGDINPLHVDPNIASIQNFEKPILHGKIINYYQRFSKLRYCC
jgi:peroxisomal enoyl-CoA hydratase 2